MGMFTKVVEIAVDKELDRVVNGIHDDMKGIVGGHTRSGAAVGAIHIEGGGHSYFIGGTGGEGTKHLYWLNEGNGSGRITASGRALGKYPGGIPGIGWRHSVSTYDGIHFVEEIAAKYGG